MATIVIAGNVVAEIPRTTLGTVVARKLRATILAQRRQGPTGPLRAVDRAAVENDLEQAGGRSLAVLAAATSEKTAAATIQRPSRSSTAKGDFSTRRWATTPGRLKCPASPNSSATRSVGARSGTSTRLHAAWQEEDTAAFSARGEAPGTVSSHPLSAPANPRCRHEISLPKAFRSRSWKKNRPREKNFSPAGPQKITRPDSPSRGKPRGEATRRRAAWR